MITSARLEIQRYLYTIHEQCFEMLSEASRAMLLEIGGLMREDELDAFERMHDKQFVIQLKCMDQQTILNQYLPAESDS